MSVVDGIPFFAWVVALVTLYLVRRRQMRGKDGRYIFWVTLGFAFCLLPIAGASFFLRYFGHVAMLIWLFVTFGLGLAFTAFSGRYETRDNGGTG